mgnify:FL=1
MDPAQALNELKREYDYFVGIDSDGCVFDTMEIKHKECFTPNFIKHWGLQAVSKYAREAWEFVNLYSKTRGANRWPALVLSMELLAERPEVRARGQQFPDLGRLKNFIDGDLPKSNEGLARYIEQYPGDPVLERALAWSEEVNDSIAQMVEGVPPFPYVRESLEKLRVSADLIVVSQTPCAALMREWEEHDLAKYVKVIAGQEMGKKGQHLQMGSAGCYGAGRMLMIGDAPGDWKAAEEAGALFYPINPGGEEASWERFLKEASEKFLEGRYAGDYEAQLIGEFESHLPEFPPWGR